MENRDWRAEADARKAAILATLESLKLSISSRNKAGKSPSLNWRVTVQRNGRDVLTTDYTAGMAHCPGYSVKTVPAAFRPHGYRNASGKPYPGTSSMFRSATPAERLKQYREAICAAECESGFPMEIDQGGRTKRKPKATAILPDAVDVFYSLVMDSSVLDAGGFEDWASDLGYDPDSRKAESIYRACLDIALKLRAAIGDAGMETLKTAFEDY